MANFTPQPPNVPASSFASISMIYARRLVIQLSNPDLREYALNELSKLMKDMFQELAPLLWNSFGVAALFLQEINSIYPILSTPELLTKAQSTRVCNVLALLKGLASHPDTKLPFLRANMPIYLYPYLRTTYKLAPFENLRLASLEVIAAMVKEKTREVIGFLLASEVMPLCLQNMDVGKDKSKTVATFIVEQILSDGAGMAYACVTKERYLAVIKALDKLANVQNQPSIKLVMLLTSCYTHLNEKAEMYLPKSRVSPPPPPPSN